MSEESWIIKSRDGKTGLVRERAYENLTDFAAAAREVFNDIWRDFISATLPDGSVLDEIGVRRLVLR
jgi:hypothetical protein